MILARQVFQVKFGHMDKLLAALKAAAAEGPGLSMTTRVLTDISGPNFTLVLEAKAESLDAYWEALQAMFANAGGDDPMSEYIESGHREFYNIEYEAEG